MCLEANLKHCGRAILRLEDRGLIGELPSNCDYFIARKMSNKWQWREELLMQLHSSGFNPDYFIFPDEDEIMPSIKFDFYGQMMFTYNMVTNGGHKTFVYPALAHAKAFKYERDLTYNPYFHCARVGRLGAMFPEVFTDKKIDHYCFFEKRWMDKKERSITERYPDYFIKYPKYENT